MPKQKNDIVVIDPPKMSVAVAMQILAPREAEDEISALFNAHAEHDHNAFQIIPPRIKIAPGGLGVFVTEDGESFKEITGVIALAQKKRGYWPSKDTTNKPPLCSSPDGDIGFLIELGMADDQQMFTDAATAFNPHPALPLLDAQQPIPEQFFCRRCPLSKWRSEHQSGNGGPGKACKEMRRLIMILDGFTTPVIFTLPPTSCKPFDQFASGIEARGGKYFGVRVRVRQNVQQSRGGTKYGVAEFSIEGQITDFEEAEAVIALREGYENLISDLDVTVDEYEHVEPDARAVEGQAKPKEEDQENVPF